MGCAEAACGVLLEAILFSSAVNTILHSDWPALLAKDLFPSPRFLVLLAQKAIMVTERDGRQPLSDAIIY